MNRILYLGLEVPSDLTDQLVIHCPVIQIRPRSKENVEVSSSIKKFSIYTHLIFTSKSAVSIFFEYASCFGIPLEEINSKSLIAVGKHTAERIRACGGRVAEVAVNETAEGLIELLSDRDWSQQFFFWPHSSLSRPLLKKWFETHLIPHQTCVFYDTVVQKIVQLPLSDDYDEIIFTSPSTIEAFIEIFGSLPSNKHYTCIGPVTKKYLYNILGKTDSTKRSI